MELQQLYADYDDMICELDDASVKNTRELEIRGWKRNCNGVFVKSDVTTDKEGNHSKTFFDLVKEEINLESEQKMELQQLYADYDDMICELDDASVKNTRELEIRGWRRNCNGVFVLSDVATHKEGNDSKVTSSLKLKLAECPTLAGFGGLDSDFDTPTRLFSRDVCLTELLKQGKHDSANQEIKALRQSLTETEALYSALKDSNKNVAQVEEHVELEETNKTLIEQKSKVIALESECEAYKNESVKLFGHCKSLEVEIRNE